MTGMLTRLADRALARVAPKVEASAGCQYDYYLCRCTSTPNRTYMKRCMYGCSGVPNHCYPCALVSLPCP